MLCEFASDTEVKYLDLDRANIATTRELVEKYNTPFKLTDVSGDYPTKYCFPINKNTWIGMYFIYNYKKKGELHRKTHDTCVPTFFWVKVVAREVGSYDRLLRLRLLLPVVRV